MSPLAIHVYEFDRALRSAFILTLMPTLLFRSMQVDSTIVMTESAKKPAEIVAGGTAGAANEEEAKPAAKLGNDPACSHL
jgi:hypothetical protein